MKRYSTAVRLRLTLLFGAVVLIAGFALLLLTFSLVRDALGRLPEITAADLRRQEDAIRSSRDLPQLLLEIRREERTLAWRDVVSRSLQALLIASVGTLIVGWFVAGGALRPLRRIVHHVRNASAASLDARLNWRGPADEFHELADAYDAMFGRLQAAFDSQRRFAAMASHELRTPLAIIRAESDVMLGAPDATDRERRMASAMRSVVERNERLVEGLLALSRAESTMIERKQVDLAELAGNVAGELAPSADARRIEMTLELGNAAVLGDRLLLRQLVTNLVKNAIRHNLNGGWLSLSVGRDVESDTVRLEVRNGGAVVTGDLERLFEPFRQGGSGREDGAGLGLAIVRAVVLAHGGSVEAGARTDGGLDVVVRLPSRRE
ncbi:MAG: HAMP domain-containing protein [Chloroflexia bacterium]|nr:HAMP domain-containing protein [Chloroflexia bacterium]